MGSLTVPFSAIPPSRSVSEATRNQRAVALAMFEYGDLPAALDANTR
jgi:hypothetical protein